MTHIPTSDSYVKSIAGVNLDRRLNVFTGYMSRVRDIMVDTEWGLILHNCEYITEKPKYYGIEVSGNKPVRYDVRVYEKEPYSFPVGIQDNQNIAILRNPEARATYKEQQTLIPEILAKHPNTQFIISTASPLILTTVKPENIWVVYEDEDKWYHPERSYGLNADEIYQEILGLDTTYAPAVATKVHKIDRLINDEQFDEAEKLIHELAKETGGAPILYGLRTALYMEQGL